MTLGTAGLMTTKPLLIYDGDCSFCRRWITRWQHLTGDAVEYQPYQRAAEHFPQIPRENFGQAVHLVEPDGTITRGAQAVFRSLARAGQYRELLWLYDRLPPFRWLTETVYGFIARHRDPVDRIDKIVVGRETRPATYVLTRALFLRLMGLVYLIAFSSLYAQVDGLIGSNGILPASGFVEGATRLLGSHRWWQAPTLAYISASDGFLHALCIGGMVCSVLLMIGVAPLLMTIVTWACYLSLTVVGQIFLGYQWDALLLEAGFLAILWAPPFWVTTNSRPSRVVLFLLRWLLLRLMFLSAMVKWFSGDESWRHMTALRYHFETQPIPTWTSWYAYHSPNWLLAVACACMFITEAIVPFLYFAPRRTRFLAFWLTVLLQVSIMATGNYGFFNILAIVLAVPLLDDAAVSRLLRRPIPAVSPLRPMVRPWIVWPIAAVLFVVGVMTGIDRLTGPREWPAPLAAVQRGVAPFEVANSYGLFAAMTKKRPEIIVEGSEDGREWKPYAFKWKAGDVNRRPRFCEPHMPRLDWQMWFQALYAEGGLPPDQPDEWFLSFAVRLLQGQPEVLKLMDGNPFPDKPPKYVRAVLYDYHFSSGATKSSTAAWWDRQPLRIYLQPISLNREPAPDFHL